MRQREMEYAVFMTADQHQKLMENPVKYYQDSLNYLDYYSGECLGGRPEQQIHAENIQKLINRFDFTLETLKKCVGFLKIDGENTKKTVQKILIDLLDLLEEDCR